MAEPRWHRVSAFAKVIEGFAGDEARLREQVHFFADLTEEEIRLARDLASFKGSEAGRAERGE